MPAVMKTETGLVRKQNEDAAWFDENKGVFAVADGMGGHLAGEVASAMAIEKIRKMSEEEKTPSISALRRAILEANQSILDRAYEHDECRGMGTTLSVLWRGGSNLYIAHVGDSRCYLYRDGHLEQITDDHSMVMEMVRAGVLTPEQAAVHPMRNVITRAVGSDRSVQVDILTRERKAGDLWLFCSDGLHGQVEEQEIVEYLHLPIAQAADALLKAAMDAGAPDNVSLVLVLDKGDEA